jgi:hypothetical protein
MDQFASERYPQKLCIRYVSGPRNQLHQSLSGIHRFPSGSNKGHKHSLLNRSRHRWALDPRIFLRFPPFLFCSPLDEIHQTPLQLSLGLHLRCAVHLGGGGDVFAPNQSLHFFERKPAVACKRTHSTGEETRGDPHRRRETIHLEVE